MRTRLFLLPGAALTILTTVAVSILNVPRLHAQPSPTAANSPVFDVASVKPTKSDAPLPFVRSPGRFAARAPLRVFIQNAYHLLQDAQLVGGPRWLTSDRFDIVATAPGNPSPEQVSLMLRALLADRFKLVVHREKRELPIYALVRARDDGKLGERIRPAAVDCQEARGRANVPLPAASQASGRVTCGMRFSAGNLMAGGIPLTVLADRLAPFVGRVVVDHTGLAGTFDLDLEWTPDSLRVAQLPPDVPRPPPVNPDGPSLFTAVQEQLGLTLESTRAPVEVLVIDSVSPPTPD